MTKSNAQIADASSPGPARWRRAAPVVTLLLLSPFISEVLFGATHMTTLFVFVPQMGTWGCGALIIRYLVQHQQRNWTSILLLGIALATAEECVIQQTSLAPLVGVDPARVYGRILGVNWVYLLWALGYESIWAVVLPVQLTETVFPARRDDSWIGRRGLAIAVTVFVLASVVAWYSWTQVARPQVFHVPSYQPPLRSLLIALTIITVLAVIALVPQSSPRPGQRDARPAPRPWLVGTVTCALSLPWFLLLALAYGAAPALPSVIPIVIGLVLAASVFFLIRCWAAGSSWHDIHRLAAASGALVASMLAGFKVSGIVLPVDYIGKLVFDGIAILLLARLSSRLRASEHTRST